MTKRKDSLRPEVQAAIEAAHEKHASEVTVLDLEGLGAFTDYFLLCTGFSSPQVVAICDEVEKRVEHIGKKLLHREGKPGGDWMLLDFGVLIVHVFTEHGRHFYDLERLWRPARRMEFKDPAEPEGRMDTPAEAEG